MYSSNSTDVATLDNTRLVETVYRLARHWKLSAGFFIATVLLTLLGVWFAPRSYRSESKLYIRLGRESASLDPTAMIGRPSGSSTPMISGRENEINSITEILQSRVLLEKVVDAVGPQAILQGTDVADADLIAVPGLPEQASSIGQVAISNADLSNASEWPRKPNDRDRAIIKLQAMIEVQAIKKSDVVRVACNTNSPRLAQKIVTQLVDFYLDEHLRLNRTPGAEEFLERQTAEMRAKLVGTEEDLRKLKDKTGLAAPDVQRGLIVSRAGRLEDELLSSAADLRGAEVAVRQLREQVATMPTTITTSHTVGIPNHGAELMRHELYQLQLLEQDLASKYTDEHFSMQQMHERLPAAKGVLAETEDSHEQVTNGPNPVYYETRATLVKQELLLSTLRTKTDALQTQLAQVREQIKTVNADELQIAQLARDLKWHESNYQSYAQHLEQNRIDQALEIGRISSINIMQPATFEPKSVGPKVLTNLGLGFMVAVLGAIGLPLIVEAIDLPLTSPKQIESHLGVGVLASIPRFRHEQLSGTDKAF